jgi:hypothetical protein
MPFPTPSFWHPVGPHIGSTLEAIVAQKRRNLVSYGYTFWAFAPRTVASVEAWRGQLREHGLTRTVAVCCGDNAVDPHKGDSLGIWMRESSEDLLTWAPMPTDMTNYHRPPNSKGSSASAFVVDEIEVPEGVRVTPPSRWFNATEGRWEETRRLPTRGEYLVGAPEEASKGRRVRLVLRLREPFVVWVR